MDSKWYRTKSYIRLESNYWEIGEDQVDLIVKSFYDRGEEYDPEHKGISLLEEETDNERYVEIWNNVFSMYNAKEGVDRKDYKELPNKNIDTGIGLERMACIIQETKTNYETDLFMPIIKKIEEISSYNYNDMKAFKVIADHVRTLVFAISDGATFSNEGRGYVLRRLLRRAAKHGKTIGMEEPFMYKLVDTVVDIMKEFYPNLVEKASFVKEVIIKEEQLFQKTLLSGEKRLKELMDNSSSKEISGEEIFKLYDTYGFPFELTLEYMKEHGFSASKDEFDKCMERQKEMARNARRNEIV